MILYSFREVTVLMTAMQYIVNNQKNILYKNDLSIFNISSAIGIEFCLFKITFRSFRMFY